MQGLAFAAVALAFGMPFGFAVGRRTWSAVAGGLGFATDTVLPGWAFLIVPGVVGALVLIAAIPARDAARTPAADLLRNE